MKCWLHNLRATLLRHSPKWFRRWYEQRAWNRVCSKIDKAKAKEFDAILTKAVIDYFREFHARHK
jgi:hypothetical protein